MAPSRVPTGQLAAALALFLFVAPAHLRADWPEFRGPNQQGHAPEGAKVPVEWSPSRNVAWRTPIPGKGWSTPVVSGGRVYLTTAVAEGGDDDALPTVPRSLRALALDAATGAILWNREVFTQGGESAPGIHSKNSHASPTPIVAQNRLFLHFGHQGTACLDLEGRSVWQNRDLRYHPVHGNGGSPVLVGNRLIFSGDGPPDPFVAALHAGTGRLVWKTPRNTAAPRKFSFSTPLVVTSGRSTEVIAPASGSLIAYDPDRGTERWRCDWGEGYSVVPRPVAAHGLVFASSGYDRAVLYAVRLGGRGNVTASHVAWTASKAVPRNASFLVVGDYLFTVDDKGIGTCYEARSGAVAWQERLLSDTSASPVYAGGRIYAIDEQGTCVVFAPEPTLRILGTNRLGERTLASMAVDQDALLIRTEKALYRIEAAP